MRSVADDLRKDLARRVEKRPVSERIALALRLGDDDVRLYCETRGVSDGEARRAFARARRVGRIPSRSNDPDRA